MHIVILPPLEGKSAKSGLRNAQTASEIWSLPYAPSLSPLSLSLLVWACVKAILSNLIQYPALARYFGQNVAPTLNVVIFSNIRYFLRFSAVSGPGSLRADVLMLTDSQHTEYSRSRLFQTTFFPSLSFLPFLFCIFTLFIFYLYFLPTA